MKRFAGWIAITALVALGSLAAPSSVPAKDDSTKYAEKLIDAKQVFQELMSTPDRGVPKELVENAKCIVVIPGMI